MSASSRTPLNSDGGEPQLPESSVATPSTTSQSAWNPQYKARERITQKMTRDGLVERNETTGVENRVSKRVAESSLSVDSTNQQASAIHRGKPAVFPDKRKMYDKTYRRFQAKQEPEQPEPQRLHSIPESAPAQQRAEPEVQQRQTEPYGKSSGVEKAPDTDAKLKPHKDSSYHHVKTSPLQTKQDVLRHEEQPIPTLIHSDDTQNTVDPVAVHANTKTAATGRLLKPAHGSKHDKKMSSRGKVGTETGVHNDGKKQTGKQTTSGKMDKPAGTKKLLPDKKPEDHDNTGSSEQVGAAPDSKPIIKSNSKLSFSEGEEPPVSVGNRRLTKAEYRYERTNGKLEKARENLPGKKVRTVQRVYDEKTGIAKRKLYFDKDVKPKQEHIKGALPLRPVKAGANALAINAHRKLYQAEHENVEIKAMHRAEMTAEGGVRKALRLHKTAPYRKVSKLEHKAVKDSAKLTYQQAINRNPQLKSNMFSRMSQKRKIKKDYAKKAREAQKAAQRAKKAAEKTKDGVVATAKFIGRHPVITLVLLLLAFLLMIVLSMCNMGNVGIGGLGGVVASTYLADDADILAAEAAYAGLEAALQHELDNFSTLHPGFDEYIYQLDSIWHDPYVLISILSALHEGAWTINQVEGTIAALFQLQYTLDVSVSIETRYRTETYIYTDPRTGVTTEYDVEVAYDYYICTVTLENFNLSHLPIYFMGEESLSRYALFMSSLGNRPDLFPASQYPNASTYKEYGRYDIPPEYLDDETFAAIIMEAEKYLGFPYVWGGYSPATSFDCSGFVSWVINHTGWNVGRLGASGLCNICTAVSPADAKPGDLIFFWKTYNAPNPNAPTHVGIYVGDGMMLHCGDPIGYVSTETAYWQSHFYSYGRLPGLT